MAGEIEYYNACYCAGTYCAGHAGITMNSAAGTYCGCSYTWGYDFATGRMTEVRIPCAGHATASQGPSA